MHIAVIGTGISGALFAHLMGERSTVTLFEKARGAGGRLSCHRSEHYYFDKGAQDFVSKNHHLVKIIQSALDEKILALWQPSFMKVDNKKKQWVDTAQSKIYSGQGPLNTLVKWLLGKALVHYGCQVIRLERRSRQWMLHLDDKSVFGPFDKVIMTQPVPQAVKLVPEIKPLLNDIAYSSCFMLYLGLKSMACDVHTPDVIYSSDTLTKWLIQSHLKPGFNTLPSLTIQSKNIDYTQEKVAYDAFARDMLSEAENLLGTRLEVDYHHHHMWRYAKVLKKSARDCFWMPDFGVGLIGDGFVQHASCDVEGAMLSAISLADQMD